MTRRTAVVTRRLLVSAGLAVGLLAVSQAAPALAASPWWHLETRSAPTQIAPTPGTEVQLWVTASNLGNAASPETPGSVTLTDAIPAHLHVTSIIAKSPAYELLGTGKPPPFTCTPEAGGKEPSGTVETVSCAYDRRVGPYETLVLQIKAKVEGDVSGGLAENKVGLQTAGLEKPLEASVPLPVSSSPVPFGVERFSLSPENEGGSADVQAGSHPYQLTSQFNLNEIVENAPQGRLPALPETFKDLSTKLPAGLIGTANKSQIPRCPFFAFSTFEGSIDQCPDETAIGVAIVAVKEPHQFGVTTRVVPLFNLEPEEGEPARFGFEVLRVPVVLDAKVRSGEDYSVNVSVNNASTAADVLSSTVVFWGVPGDPSHTASRGWDCLVNGANMGHERTTPCPELKSTPAFLTLPTSCEAPLKASAAVDTWANPGSRRPDETAEEGDPRWKKLEAPPLAPLTGCDKLPFSPEISVTPDTAAANTPSGVKVDVKLNQAGTLVPGGLAEAAVRSSTVTLPPGMLLSPSAATGLEACSPELVGFLRREPLEGVTTNVFTSQLPRNWEEEGFCPPGSKVGTVSIKSPDIEEELVGSVYLAQQNANPFGSLFAMYIVAETPTSHVVAKLAGQIEPDPNTGQITTVFENTPQVPFEDLTLNLNGGPRASVTTPPTCGSYPTKATFVAWSGAVAPIESAPFPISSGPGGSPCANPQPLSPGFEAGVSNLQAGGFTNFSMTLTHSDTDQAPNSLTLHLPPGLAAMISSVQLCPEAQAQAGTCGPGSLIGHATAVAGLGSSPFTESGGQVFITEAPKSGPYQGASFGLSIVIPTKAGPFDFGNVVTHAGLYVDPATTAVTVKSELPTMVNSLSAHTGVPVQLKAIHVTVDRPNFQFNPTNCNRGPQVTAEVTGVQGGSASRSTPLQVANCAALPFHPELTAELNSQFDKNNGLAMKIVVKSTPGQANIQKTKVVFPLQVPSRLSTIQKACPDTVFEKNPALCNEGSVIGKAIAHTPVLKNPLVGPAYLVSHGNRAFPDAEFVLQGEGITLILDGETNIHNGITSSTFNAVPDAPVTTFEVELPRGPHSAFTGYGNLCSPTTTVTVKKRVTVRSHGKTRHVLRSVKEVRPQPLMLPTILGGQNGHTIEKTTPIKVTGCAGVKGSKSKKKPSKKKKKHGKAGKSKKH